MHSERREEDGEDTPWHHIHHRQSMVEVHHHVRRQLARNKIIGGKDMT
jgi:hypothetical protein